MDRQGETAFVGKEGKQKHLLTGVGLNLRTELPKWTRVSQRINPPGF